MERTDEDLVALSREGDMLAFKELVLRHEGKVAGVVKVHAARHPRGRRCWTGSVYQVL